MVIMKQRRSGRLVIPKKSKIAFVCSGGAAKAGAFHIGVALALREKGFRFIGGLQDAEHYSAINSQSRRSSSIKMANQKGRDISIYVGSSAGSLICSFLAAGYSLDQIFDSFLREAKSKQSSGEKPLKPLTYYEMFSFKRESGLLSTLAQISSEASPFKLTRFVQDLTRESYETMFKMKWLKLSGFFSTAGIERYMREDVLPSNNFSRYNADLFIVATQLNHSRKVVFGKYDHSEDLDNKNCIYANDVCVSQAVAASTSLPPIFSPYPITSDRGKKTYYFDGEIRDTLSTHVAVDHGADLVFASYTHQPYHYVKRIGSLHHFGMPAILIQALYLMIERKIHQYRQFHDRSQAAYDAVSEFFTRHQLSEEMKQECLKMLEKKLHFKRNVDWVYIHPRTADYEMFFGDHFNLNSNKLKELVRIGFRSAIHVLRKYEFE